MGVVSTGTIWALGWQRLGMAVIVDSLRWAAFGLTGASTNGEQAVRIRESITFIAGSGLDYALDQFGIEADPRVLRYSFKRWVQQREGPFIWSHWLLTSAS